GVVSGEGKERGYAIRDDGEVLGGTAESPFEPDPEATVADGSITAVPGYELLTFDEILQQQEEITSLRVGFADANEGSIRTQTGSTGFLYQPSLSYDEATGALTDTTTGVVYRDNGEGRLDR